MGCIRCIRAQDSYRVAWSMFILSGVRFVPLKVEISLNYTVTKKTTENKLLPLTCFSIYMFSERKKRQPRSQGLFYYRL